MQWLVGDRWKYEWASYTTTINQGKTNFSPIFLTINSDIAIKVILQVIGDFSIVISFVPYVYILHFTQFCWNTPITATKTTTTRATVIPHTLHIGSFDWHVILTKYTFLLLHIDNVTQIEHKLLTPIPHQPCYFNGNIFLPDWENCTFFDKFIRFERIIWRWKQFNMHYAQSVFENYHSIGLKTITSLEKKWAQHEKKYSNKKEKKHITHQQLSWKNTICAVCFGEKLIITAWKAMHCCC